jgi:hypothetical protein
MLGEPVDHGPTTEDLRLQVGAACAGLQQLVDEDLHRIDAIARGRIMAVGQQEMVHAAHAGAAVAQARCHAGPEHGHQHDVIIMNEILPRQDLPRPRAGTQ